MVEFAMVGMILLVIVAGAIDYGLGWRSAVAITEGARAGARVGAGMARNPRTDYEVFSAVRASLLSAGRLEDVERVILYRSDSADGVVPSTCDGAPYSGRCIVLTGAQLNAIAPSNFSYVWNSDPAEEPTGTGCMTGNRTYATSAWCPTHRKNSLNDAEYLGIEVTVRTDNLFPVLGETQVITRSAVMKLEPEPL